MQHLKIFTVEPLGSTVIVTPHGEGSAFRYQDLHLEANTIRGQLTKPGVRFLVIDLKEMEYFGSEFIGALVSMLREMRSRGGKACFCAATPQMLQVLQNMSLFKLWPHYPTREDALNGLTAAAPAKA
ncbi:STAS domain-containing protein [Planctomicrobium piriforme]|uniref:Anti-anti-sigma factor n=1 Tax=Planctomicrobium piriforme TaxID=1576369 RepID=A0A1I3GVE3_9PLAN|nr:STAS domain-containing protein [Planctomicrobium piriforme]SFI27331.1 anti-anti-sigma factor [Planctomicrobium piriforme]